MRQVMRPGTKKKGHPTDASHLRYHPKPDGELEVVDIKVGPTFGWLQKRYLLRNATLGLVKVGGWIFVPTLYSHNKLCAPSGGLLRAWGGDRR